MVCRRTRQVWGHQLPPNAAVSKDTPTKLEYEGVSSGKAKLTQIFIKIEIFSPSSSSPHKIYHNTCIEIPLITPIHSAATIPVGGNQGRGSNPSIAKGP
ncbi:hypothetical protein Tco_0540918, partial [Tanacetum coccineum]